MSKYQIKDIPQINESNTKRLLVQCSPSSQSSNPCECRGCAKAEFHKNADWHETNERSFIFVSQIVARLERRRAMATPSADPRDRVKRTDL